MPAFYSAGFLDQVRHSNDIVEIVGAVIPLKRTGASFVGLCPFHREKTPSFSVNPQKQIFYCFGCHKGGDVYRFIQEYEGLNFAESVVRLAERARIPVEHRASEGQVNASGLKDLLLSIHDQLTHRWHHALLNDAAGQIARDYLNKRKISLDAVKRFRLGFALNAWDDTFNWSKTKGFEIKAMIQAGLILQREEGGGYYDRFRNRLMFPICDEQGRIIGFSGRILEGDSKSAKYVNSPETPLFHKSRVIYGLDKARREILEQKVAVVCEGQIDTIACHMAGIGNVVAPQGTALTLDHARVLKRYADEVVLCFDADPAGQNAAVRALDDLLQSGLSIRVATIPPPHDPDSFLQTFGVDAFRLLIKQAPGFFDFYLDYLGKTHGLKSEKGKATIVKLMGEAAQKTGNAVVMDTCAQKTSQRIGVSLDAVRAEFRKAHHPSAARRRPHQINSPNAKQEAPEKPHPQEYWLLKLVLTDDDLAPLLIHHIQWDWISSEQVRLILKIRLDMSREGSWNGTPSLLDRLEDRSLQSLVAEAVSDTREIPNPETQLYDCMIHLRNRHADKEIDRINRSLSELSDPQTASALDQLKKWREIKNSRLKPSA